MPKRDEPELAAPPNATTPPHSVKRHHRKPLLLVDVTLPRQMPARMILCDLQPTHLTLATPEWKQKPFFLHVRFPADVRVDADSVEGPEFLYGHYSLKLPIIDAAPSLSAARPATKTAATKRAKPSAAASAAQTDNNNETATPTTTTTTKPATKATAGVKRNQRDASASKQKRQRVSSAEAEHAEDGAHDGDDSGVTGKRGHAALVDEKAAALALVDQVADAVEQQVTDKHERQRTREERAKQQESRRAERKQQQKQRHTAAVQGVKAQQRAASHADRAAAASAKKRNPSNGHADKPKAKRRVSWSEDV